MNAPLALVLALTTFGISASMGVTIGVGVPEAAHAEASPPPPLLRETGERRLPDYLVREARPDGTPRDWGFAELGGRPIVALSWATWCGVCRRDLPGLDRLQARLADTRVLVAALSIDEGGAEVAAEALKKRGLTHLRPFHDPDKMFFLSTGAVGVPAAVIADREGRIVARVQGSVRWDDPRIESFLRSLDEAAEDEPKSTGAGDAQAAPLPAGSRAIASAR